MKFIITLSDVIKIILGSGLLIFFVWFAKTFGIKNDKEDKDDQNLL